MPYVKIKQNSELDGKLVKSKLLEQKTFLVDTNFLIRWRSSKENSLVKKFLAKAKEVDCQFFRNIVIEQELLKWILETTVERAVLIELKEQKVEWCLFEKKLQLNDKKLKTIREKAPEVFQKGLEGIQKELEFFERFPYISSIKGKSKIERTKLHEFIYKYGLNSSDAMIANFVLSLEEIDGLVTYDSDFQYCEELVKAKTVIHLKS